MFCNGCGKELGSEQTSCNSCGSPVVAVAHGRPPTSPRRGKVRAFWNRVTEGQAVNQLWSELRADARTSYRFYARDVDREDLDGRSKVRRFFRFFGQLFWAIVMKLSPARRVVITRSEKGCLVVTREATEAVPAIPVAHVVDATGAGDLFAAGFL